MAAYAIQFRRGNTTQHNSFTGLLGEVTVDTDKKTLVVHDGSTTGGFPLAREGAASNASSGSFTSNVTIGGTIAVTSTASFSDDVTITGDLGMTGHIIPSANITYDLGSLTNMWRDVYVGPGSLYVNGKKVIEDNSGTIQITTDANQNLKVETTGTGTLQLSSGAGIAITGEVNASVGDLQFGDHLDMNSNRIKEVSAPVDGADAANKTYVDSTISSQLSGGTLEIDATTGDFSGDVAIGGSLTVTGTVTTVNSETINLADNILLLNSNASGTASQNGGIEVERGDDLNVQFLWDETNDRWSVASEDLYTGGSFIGDLTGSVTGTVSSLTNHDTDDLIEGSNLYWTAARGTANFATNLAASDTDDIDEGSTNRYYTDARVIAALAAGSVTAIDTGNFAVSSSGATFDVDMTFNNSSNVSVFNIDASTGATTIAGATTISGATVINNTFNAADNVTFAGDNTFKIANSSSTNVFAIDVANTTFAIDLDMTVNNASTFNNDVTIEGNNNFTINDNSSATVFDIDVANNTTVIGGATTVKNDFAITNSSNTNLFDIDVANTNLEIDLDMTVNSTSTFNNSVTVKNSSNTTLVDMDVTSNTYDIAMDLTVNNSATFNNDIAINNSSNTTMVDIDVANATYDIAMDLTVNNTATFKNDFSVTNSSNTNLFDIDVANTNLAIDLDMTVNNSAVFNNNMTINNSSNTTMVDIDVANATYAIDMDLTVNNASIFNNNLTINNSSSTAIFDIDIANTTLDIDLDVTMNNEVTINNTLVLNNGLTLGTTAQGVIDARVRAVNLADDMATEAYADQVEVDAKAYTDTRETAITNAYEAYSDVQKGRIDAILSASSADKDTFAEIVTFVNSVDTTNDTALGTEITTRASADTALSGRLDTIEGADTVTGSVAKAEKDAKAYTDTRETAITTAYQTYSDVQKSRIDAILTASSADKDTFAEIVTFINSVDTTNDTALGTEITTRADADTALSGRLDTVEGADTVEGSVAKAEKDAKDYTDTRETAITTAYTSAISTAVAAKDNTDEITEGSTNLYFTDARALAAAKAGMSMTHSGVYVVTSTDASGNSGSSHAITAATLGFNVGGKEFYQVYINRQLLRPTEYTINSSNGTITFSSDVIATDDEIEAVIYG